MLYYGDRARTVVPREVVRRLAARLHRARGLSRDGRSAALVAALIEAGELAQAISDRAFDLDGQDGDDPLSAVALELAVAIGRALFADRGSDVAPWPDAARLLDEAWPPSAQVKTPEGYAHYALYPETYAEAARRGRGRAGRWFVVGIRSVGTSLAAAVAAGCGAQEVISVRPVGHPYHRQLRIAPALDGRVRAAIGAGAQLAVVDEGPGLSGSSFEAVATWLGSAGAAPGQVTIYPGHPGDLGPAAPEGRRRWWSGADRQVAPFDEVVLPSLARAVERAYGPGTIAEAGGGRWRDTLRPPVERAYGPGTIEEAGGGRWRDTLRPDEGSHLPVFRTHERRKYLCRREGGAFVVRFAGLGRYQEESLARAEALADAGWSPAPCIVARGFVGTPVVGRAAPEARGGARASGAQEHSPQPVVAPSSDEIARYLEFRADALPVGGDEGAAPDQLLEMLRVNATEALGVEVERRVDAYAPAARASTELPRVAVDAKLEPWEWARSEDGRLWKLDATDHAFGHDLVGCQPATWDIAGARVELGLSRERAVALATTLCAGGAGTSSTKKVVPAVLAFHEAAYLAHRIGRWTFALQLEADPQERALIEGVLGRYRALLRTSLAY